MWKAVFIFTLVSAAAPVNAAPAPATSQTKIRWKRVQPGVQYAVIKLRPGSKVGDNRLHVVRVEPKRSRLFAGLAKLHGNKKRTARQWARRSRLSVVINLGMFKTDHRTHVGYTRRGRFRDNRRWRKDYLSALAFGPRKKGLASAVMVDLDQPGTKKRLASYRVVVQNLRLIKAVGGKGVNVWRNRPKKWSEAALAADNKGRLLFLFCRSPFRMAVLNRYLLALPLGIVRAMHLEGGPEASLTIRGGGVKLDLAGSFESRFNENDKNRTQWRLPNVLGVRRVRRVRRRPGRRRRRSRRRR
jgi:hypothetical protein